jgi:hypothetical protein
MVLTSLFKYMHRFLDVLIIGTDLERGEAMVTTERRHPENALLREKINHIQQVSEQLHALVAQAHTQTVSWAREGKVVDLPHANLASHLSRVFQQQRSALAQMQEGIQGVELRMAKPALITDEELAALMK